MMFSRGKWEGFYAKPLLETTVRTKALKVDMLDNKILL